MHTSVLKVARPKEAPAARDFCIRAEDAPNKTSWHAGGQFEHCWPHSAHARFEFLNFSNAKLALLLVTFTFRIKSAAQSILKRINSQAHRLHEYTLCSFLSRVYTITRLDSACTQKQASIFLSVRASICIGNKYRGTQKHASFSHSADKHVRNAWTRKQASCCVCSAYTSEIRKKCINFFVAHTRTHTLTTRVHKNKTQYVAVHIYAKIVKQAVTFSQRAHACKVCIQNQASMPGATGCCAALWRWKNQVFPLVGVHVGVSSQHNFHSVSTGNRVCKACTQKQASIFCSAHARKIL